MRALAAGQELSHYRVISPLGAGGMGEVYLAEDLRLGRKVALKILSRGLTADEDRVRRFQQEARTISALNHPNILTIHDVGRVGDVHFIATEYVDGETLRERLATRRIDAAEALEIAVQISRALSAAHAADIVHRDVKPENVMIRRDGYTKVLDFGLAKLRDHASPLGAASDSSHRGARRNEPGRHHGHVQGTCRRSRLGGVRWMGAAICSHSASRCTRCSRGRCRSVATRPPTCCPD